MNIRIRQLETEKETTEIKTRRLVIPKPENSSQNLILWNTEILKFWNNATKTSNFWNNFQSFESQNLNFLTFLMQFKLIFKAEEFVLLILMKRVTQSNDLTFFQRFSGVFGVFGFLIWKLQIWFEVFEDFSSTKSNSKKSRLKENQRNSKNVKDIVFWIWRCYSSFRRCERYNTSSSPKLWSFASKFESLKS